MVISSMYQRELDELESHSLLRRLLSRVSAQGPVVRLGRKSYVNFASNDYLGLAGDPGLAAAAGKALRRYGCGSGASRLLGGGTVLHEKLEGKVARFKGTEAALLFNSGYAANAGVIPALAGEKDALFSDELNHASIIDGCRLSRARTFVYRHRDVSHLESLLRTKKSGRKIVVTDSVFSMDGDIAPLADLFELCGRHGAILYIDDAHGTGVLGDGRGALCHFGLEPEPWVIQMGTFSKALGSFGAFVAASQTVISWLLNTARTFMFSTAIPACEAAASMAAIGEVGKNGYRLRRLWQNRELLAGSLRETGWDTGASETPIIPVLVRDVRTVLELSSFLMEGGIYAPAIRPPTVRQPRLRITVSASHEERHIKLLVEAMRRFRTGLHKGT